MLPENYCRAIAFSGTGYVTSDAQIILVHIVALLSLFGYRVNFGFSSSRQTVVLENENFFLDFCDVS